MDSLSTVKFYTADPTHVWATIWIQWTTAGGEEPQAQDI